MKTPCWLVSSIILLSIILTFEILYMLPEPITSKFLEIKSQMSQNPTFQPDPIVSPSLLYRNNYVRDCISYHKVRRISGCGDLEPFNRSIHVITVKENAKQRQQSFKEIYKEYKWGHIKSATDTRVSKVQGSGLGSTLNWAQEIIGTLHIVINEIKMVLGKKVITILDIPCGDFVWMSRFLQGRTDVKYTGIDIVPSLIENHKRAFNNDPNLSFINQDIVETPLNQGYDLILCRHMLQHLTNEDVMKVLYHFNKSGSRYLLTSTVPGTSVTSSLSLDGGRYRNLNMEIPPVKLEPPLCLVRDGPRDGNENVWHLYIGLWKFPLRQVKSCNVQRVQPRPPFVGSDFYTCA